MQEIPWLVYARSVYQREAIIKTEFGLRHKWKQEQPEIFEAPYTLGEILKLKGIFDFEGLPVRKVYRDKNGRQIEERGLLDDEWTLMMRGFGRAH